MFDMIRHHILHLLQKDGTPRPLAVLEQELGIRPDGRGAFRQVLDELCAEGRVILGPRNVVKLPALSDEVTGVFKAHAQGYGFVNPQQDGFDEDVFIPAKAAGFAMSGDRVLVQIKRKGLKHDPDRITGRIIKILERAHQSVVGILRQHRDRWIVQPDVPRYTKSVFLTFNKDGQVLATRFCHSVIKSQARLTYQQVDRILKGESLNQSRDVIALLKDAESLARCLQARRHQAGMLHLDMPETEVILDYKGLAVDVMPKDTSYPHIIIEMFMVEANVAVARLLDRYCIPFMRRIHPAPNLQTLRQLSQTLRLLGVNLSRQPKRVQLQGLLDQLGDTRLTVPVNLLVLRSLAKAVYSPAAVSHYALAASQYCHFTSPIRRYADLLVQYIDMAWQTLYLTQI